jgi:hypothetical protein
VKRVLALVALGALVGVTSGCDLSPPAATVNGVTISQSQLQSQLSQASGNSVVQCALTVQEAASGRSLPPVGGNGDSTVTTSFAAFVLDRLVQQTLEEQALARRSVRVGASDLAAARLDYESELAAASQQLGSPCNLAGSALIDQLPRAFIDQQARLVADQEKLEEVAAHLDVSTGALRAYYLAHQSDVTEYCVNLIVANDQASALSLYHQISAGTPFASAAAATGAAAGTPAGGQGPCVEPSALVQQLGAANAQAVESLAVGQVAPPEAVLIPNQITGATTTTWIVIGLRARQLLPFADVESQLRQELLSQRSALLSAALNAGVRAAHVQLDPRYGSWSLSHGVTVPSPPRPAFVLNPAIGSSTSAGPASAGSPSG